MEIEPLPPSPSRTVRENFSSENPKELETTSLLSFEVDQANHNVDSMKSFDIMPRFWNRESNSVGAGLRNIANTCYLNSVLQCILHTVPMMEKLRSFYHHHPILGVNSDFCSLCALKNLSDNCRAKSGWCVSPQGFTSNLRKISPDFCLGEQEDAHEFLLCLLDNLHNCCVNSSSNGQPSSINEDSIVKHVYGGHSISQLRCCECGHCSNTPEPLLDLSLEINEADTIIDALKSFTKVEKIDETKFTCEGCRAQVSMEKQTKIDQAPTVISLHLKRFRNDGWFIDKIDKFVEYPLELDLRPFITCPKDGDQTIYELYAILVHRGGASYGHYYCFIRSSPNTWHSMDDSTVNRVAESDVLKERAYILFYIKQGSLPWFSSLMKGQKLKDSSPTSVLDHMGLSFSSSSEETCSSSSNEVSEKDEEPSTSSDVYIESHTDQPEHGHSPCTSHAFDDISQPNRAHSPVMSGFQVQPKKRGNSEQFVNKFHDEPLEDAKENNLIPQVIVETKSDKNEREITFDQRKDFYKRLVGSMSPLRRSHLMPLPSEAEYMRSFLVLRTHPLNKKRRAMLSEKHLPDGEQDPNRSVRSLSLYSVRRGLFTD